MSFGIWAILGGGILSGLFFLLWRWSVAKCDAKDKEIEKKDLLLKIADKKIKHLRRIAELERGRLKESSWIDKDKLKEEINAQEREIENFEHGGDVSDGWGTGVAVEKNP